jgi:hypothetical protein
MSKQPKVFISYVPKVFKTGGKRSLPRANYKVFCKEIEAKGYLVLNTVYEFHRYQFSNKDNIEEKIRNEIKNADLIFVHPDCVREPLCRKEVFIARDMGIPDYGMPLGKREQAYVDWVKSGQKLSVPKLAEKYKLKEEQLILYIRKQQKAAKEQPPDK